MVADSGNSGGVGTAALKVGWPPCPDGAARLPTGLQSGWSQSASENRSQVTVFTPSFLQEGTPSALHAVFIC